MTLWEAAVASVLKHEGGLSMNPDDPGNWTGGQVGVGELRGTSYGISAASFPTLDIRNLTVGEARDIYLDTYWSQVPESLPDDVRWFAFDVAVNSGVGRMRAWLNEDQTLLGLAAIRLKFLAGLSTWPTFSRGWTRRVAGVLDDIREWQRAQAADDEAGAAHTAHTVVLHGFPLALRWSAFVREPSTLRGSFVWRVRGDRLDVRAARE